MGDILKTWRALWAKMACLEMDSIWREMISPTNMKMTHLRIIQSFDFRQHTVSVVFALSCATIASYVIVLVIFRGIPPQLAAQRSTSKVSRKRLHEFACR